MVSPSTIRTTRTPCPRASSPRGRRTAANAVQSATRAPRGSVGGRCASCCGARSAAVRTVRRRMDAKFSGPSYTLGVEEELMILDGETFALANEIDAITAPTKARARSTRAAAERARDRHARLEGPRRGGRPRAPAAPRGLEAAPRGSHRLRRHASDRAVGGAARLRRPALPRADRRAEVHRPPGDHLRAARPRRHRRPREGDPRRQRDARARADPARAERQLALLALRRDRAGVDPDADLPRLPARRDPAALRRAGPTTRTGSASWSTRA